MEFFFNFSFKLEFCPNFLYLYFDKSVLFFCPLRFLQKCRTKMLKYSLVTISPKRNKKIPKDKTINCFEPVASKMTRLYQNLPLLNKKYEN